CGAACPAGETCSGGTCVGPCGANNQCPGKQTCCGATCANTQKDPNNCGGCGIFCAPEQNATTGCTASTCTILSCNTGFADCNHKYGDGCEASLNTDPQNCGTCGHTCPTGQQCVSGACQASTCQMTGCPGGGIVAPTGEKCSGGRCAGSGCNGGPQCPSPLICCMSGCADTNTDTDN